MRSAGPTISGMERHIVVGAVICQQVAKVPFSEHHDTGRVCPSVATYTGQHIGDVIMDYARGRFAAAFPLYCGSA
jgi:hypothetical protein